MAEQPYVTLMLRVLAQARAEQYHNVGLLQLTLWLAYRVLDINPRSVEAYLVLAYFFCLLGESDRACRLLLHYVQAYDAQHVAIQDFLQALTPRAKASSPASIPLVEVSEGLPSLQNTLQRFSQVSAAALAHNLERATPAISRLAEHIKEMEI